MSPGACLCSARRRLTHAATSVIPIATRASRSAGSTPDNTLGAPSNRGSWQLAQVAWRRDRRRSCTRPARPAARPLAAIIKTAVFGAAPSGASRPQRGRRVRTAAVFGAAPSGASRPQRGRRARRNNVACALVPGRAAGADRCGQQPALQRSRSSLVSVAHQNGLRPDRPDRHPARRSRGSRVATDGVRHPRGCVVGPMCRTRICASQTVRRHGARTPTRLAFVLRCEYSGAASDDRAAARCGDQPASRDPLELTPAGNQRTIDRRGRLTDAHGGRTAPDQPRGGRATSFMASLRRTSSTSLSSRRKAFARSRASRTTGGIARRLESSRLSYGGSDASFACAASYARRDTTLPFR